MAVTIGAAISGSWRNRRCTMTPNQRKATALAFAAAIAIPAEGLRQVAYRDPPESRRCAGSTTNVQPGKVYSLAECKARLDADMLSAVSTVEKCAPGLPVNALAAFSDAVYNIGPHHCLVTSPSPQRRDFWRWAWWKTPADNCCAGTKRPLRASL